MVMVGGSRGPTRGRKGRLAISMVIPSNKGSDPVSRKLAPFFTLHSSQGKEIGNSFMHRIVAMFYKESGVV